MNRGKILEAWRRKRASGQTLRGGKEGPDFRVVSNGDTLDLPGARALAALLPLGDANALSLAGAKQAVPLAGETPVLAGVCATDPLRLMDKFLLELKGCGIAGVQNAPSVGLIDGVFRNNLEEAKLGYGREVEMIRDAARLDLITSAFVFSPDDARAMAEAGADLVVIHPGLGAAAPIEKIAAAARDARKGVLVLALSVAGAAAPEVEGLDGIQIE
ncbi:MAG TPA: phosphoenolpyruvate hydrolase family protein [Planctomycetota bacterium]|jgi:predicted TIM-barrel enzyme|nr:phosphoenolpyruvate hydrolase family protein [Planctomycetota bacterium]